MLTWPSHYVHMTITQCSHDHHTMLTWPSHYAHMIITLCSHDHHTMLTWPSHYAHMTITQCSHDHHTMFTWPSHYAHMTITQCSWPSHYAHITITQAIGSYGAGLIDIEELHHIECSALPGSGSCGQFIKHSNTSSVVGCHASHVYVYTQEGCLQQTPCHLP